MSSARARADVNLLVSACGRHSNRLRRPLAVGSKTGRDVVDGEKHGSEQYRHPESQNDYHERLNEGDEGVDGVIDLAAIEARHSLEDFPHVAGLLTDLNHSNDDSGNRSEE